jgi:hypothetical protein
MVPFVLGARQWEFCGRLCIRASDHFCPNRRSSARIEERVVRDELSKVRCAAPGISSRAGTSRAEGKIKFIVEADGGSGMTWIELVAGRIRRNLAASPISAAQKEAVVDEETSKMIEESEAGKAFGAPEDDPLTSRGEKLSDLRRRAHSDWEPETCQ